MGTFLSPLPLLLSCWTCADTAVAAGTGTVAAGTGTVAAGTGTGPDRVSFFVSGEMGSGRSFCSTSGWIVRCSVEPVFGDDSASFPTSDP